MAQGRTRFVTRWEPSLSIDELPLMIAVEHSKAPAWMSGVTAFTERGSRDAAVINGQADVGQGTLTPRLQKVTTPIRLFYQLSALPVSSRLSTKRAIRVISDFE